MTAILLYVMGLLGVLAQALKKMSELNRRYNGEFKFGKYLRIERFSLLLSWVFVSACWLFVYLVPDMQRAGAMLVGGQFFAGWFGQSGLEFLMGQAARKIAARTGASPEEIERLKTEPS
jgi:hypothetical protein